MKTRERELRGQAGPSRTGATPKAFGGVTNPKDANFDDIEYSLALESEVPP